jgi:glucokinase
VKALGIDIGGTNVKIAVVDVVSSSILEHRSFPTDATASHGRPSYELARRIAAEVNHLIESHEITLVGVGVPGAMSADRLLVRYPPNLIGWKEEPLKEYLLEHLREGVQVEVDNDANVATIAEGEIGAGKGINDFLLVTLGTGVGGGLYLDGKLYRGVSGGAGEFGHVSIDINGPQCACGSRGCIEAFIGQRYMIDEMHRLLDEDAVSILSALPRPIDARSIIDAARSEDEFAKDYLAKCGERLGFAMSGVAKLLDIHTLVVGGGVAQAGDLILAPALKTLREHVLPNQREHVKILPAQFSNDAGVLGAAMLAVTEAQAK